MEYAPTEGYASLKFRVVQKEVLPDYARYRTDGSMDMKEAFAKLEGILQEIRKGTDAHGKKGSAPERRMIIWD